MIAVIGRFSSAAGHASRSYSRSSRDNPSALLLLSRRVFFSVFCFVLFFFSSCIRFFCRIYESFLLLQSVIVIQQSTRIFHIIHHIIPYHTIASIHLSIHPSLCFVSVSDFALVLLFSCTTIIYSPVLSISPYSCSSFTDIYVCNVASTYILTYNNGDPVEMF